MSTANTGVRLLDELYYDNLSTGGVNPRRCHAPVKDRATFERLRKARLESEREEARVDSLTIIADSRYVPLRPGNGSA